MKQYLISQYLIKFLKTQFMYAYMKLVKTYNFIKENFKSV